MLSVDEARARVLDAVAPLAPVNVPVSEARGLVLERDLSAPHPLPRFDNSAMDGYAVRGADAERASPDVPVELELVGEVRAGDPGDLEVLPGTAARVMTGAPIARGADAVVPVEETSERDGRVIVSGAAPAGRHVRPAGEDVQAGTVLVRAGTELGPGELALLASVGLSPLPVRRGPKVAVLVTGDELVAPEAEPAPGQIRDSNSVALRALVEEAGAEVVPLPRVDDERAAVVDALRRAAELADVVVSSGGVAVGRYDFVKEAVEELGGIDLWRVAMQPGRPLVLGTLGPTPFLGLPGNPVSSHVCFEQFVRPAIRKMRGCHSLLRPTLAATLTQAIDKGPGRLHFVRVRLNGDERGWRATPTGPQGSHIQTSLIDCHGVARFERAATRLEAGAEVVVEVWRLPGGDA
ncbi:MAG: gephyrin-like molybdotransferase Glp [Actinomycetota bacterium]